MKKHILYVMILLGLILPINTLFSANPAGQGEYDPIAAASERVGRGVAKGIAAGLGEGGGEGSKRFVKDVFGAIKEESPQLGESLGGVIRGAGGAFEEGGEFDTAAQQFGGAARRGMGVAGQEVGAGMAEGMKGVGEGMQEAFREGGEFDVGMGAAVDTQARNINRFIQSTVHNNVAKLGLIGLGTAGVYITMKYGIPLYFRMLERMLTRPKLIIASSKKSLRQQIADLFKKPQEPLPMVFAPELEGRLDTITKATRNITKKIQEGKKNVKYRNLMLYGPPGTGKTMFAKELARRSGMEYAFMSGSSFAKFPEGQGIEALDELMAWAGKSKGLMIFIDEAETFLAKRENMDPNSQAYKLLNNFLNYTGERSPKFMLVFATNHKDALDSAMYRRIDDLVEMPLPGLSERKRVLTLYRDKILMDESQNGKEFVDSVKEYMDGTAIDKIAERTKGLSGGDLEGIINTIKTDADILDPALISPELINVVVDRAVEKHKSFTGGKELGRIVD